MKVLIKLPIIAIVLLVSGVMAQGGPTDGDKFTLRLRPIPEACDPLKETGDPALEKLIPTLAAAPIADKIRIATELGASCSKKFTDPLLELLNDKEPSVRIAAAEALARLGDPEAIEPLNTMQNDPDWKVRFVIGSALCSFGKYRASYGALNYFAGPSVDPAKFTEGDLIARLQTVLTVNQLVDPSYSRKTLRFMYAFLELKDEKMHAIVVEAMHLLAHTKNFPIELVGELKQALNPNFRKVVAYWLGELKIERGRDALTNAALKDSDPEVRKIAAEALKKLGDG